MTAKYNCVTPMIGLKPVISEKERLKKDLLPMSLLDNSEN